MRAQSADYEPNRSRDNLVLIAIALGTIVVHLLVGNRYGFQRDELQTMADARHLAWGYVVYPPVTPFFARLSLILFGTSIVGFRVFAFLAQAVGVVVTGLMAREMGGRRGAQCIAAAAAIPFALAGGALMQYVSFDYLSWVLTSYFVVRLIRSGDARWCLAVAAAIAGGLLSKYAMAFYIPGVVIGLLLSDARRFLKTKWFWLGIVLVLVIVLPNVLWQAKHDFISVKFLHSIHARDIRNGRTDSFLPDQLGMMLFAAPLFFAGMYFCLFSQEGRRFRALAIMYLAPLLIFAVAKGRGYYLAGAYPMLYAAGAVWGEGSIAGFRQRWRATTVRTIAWTALVADIVLVGAFFLPIAPINTPWFAAAAKRQDDFNEEIGWPELVQTIAGVRDGIPQSDRGRVAVLAGNYGEAGAVDLYGPAYGLPGALSFTNSYFYLGYGDPPPDTLIMVGFDREWVDKQFSSCQLVAHTWNRYGVLNEETRDHPDIFVCRGLRKPWPVFWSEHQRFG